MGEGSSSGGGVDRGVEDGMLATQAAASRLDEYSQETMWTSQDRHWTMAEDLSEDWKYFENSERKKGPSDYTVL